VLIPGLYMGGWAVAYLARRLQAAGWRTRRFSYPTLAGTLPENADRLARALGTLEAATVHLVAHSLGGLVVRHLFNRHPRQRPGRIVTLGTPHQGSYVARWLDVRPRLRGLLGKSGPEGLLGGAPAWRPGLELGLIAGTLSLGLGRLAPGLPLPNDGTVALAETRLARATDHIALPVSHTGLLLSASVARQVGTFLAKGQFDRT